MLKYDRFFEYLEQRNLSVADLYKVYGIPRSLIQRMKQNENIRMSTIDKLCNTLNCTPSDVWEYVPDGNVFPPKGKM